MGGPDPVTGVLVRRDNRVYHTMSEAEIGVMHLCGKECPGWLATPDTEKRQRRVLP